MQNYNIIVPSVPNTFVDNILPFHLIIIIMITGR